jgi:hypothetical protein
MQVIREVKEWTNGFFEARLMSGEDKICSIEMKISSTFRVQALFLGGSERPRKRSRRVAS